jgi:glycosyltransferase involved in cell wall biosynthesis
MPDTRDPLPNLWFDVEDLFEHVAGNRRPSGVQRVVFEIYRALTQDVAVRGRVRFVRHDRVRHTLRSVAWPDIARLFERLSSAPRDVSPPRPAPPPQEDGQLRRLADRLPPSLRQRLIRFGRLQWQAGVALADLVVFLVGAAKEGLHRATKRKREATGDDFAALVRPGDVFAVLGAPWVYPDYAGLVGDAQRRFGLRLALLVYDIIPIMRPEWFSPIEVARFRVWLRLLLPSADILFAISQATATDVARFVATDGLSLRAPVQVIPLGSGYDSFAPASPGATPLPVLGNYVLFVSTIEARKNHSLLFRVWRRLLEEMPRERVPTLVFVGRVGGLVADLMKQLENSAYLDGKILLAEDVSDVELASLYRGCLFTVFPSLYEGWGLPVTESLAFGRPCIVARGSSLPEAGGSLVRYFDPDSVSDAYAVIRAAIEDPESLRAWETDVTGSFVPVPWSATASAILQHLSPHDDADFGALPLDQAHQCGL